MRSIIIINIPPQSNLTTQTTIKLTDNPSQNFSTICWNPSLDFKFIFAVISTEGVLTIYEVLEANSFRIVASLKDSKTKFGAQFTCGLFVCLYGSLNLFKNLSIGSTISVKSYLQKYFRASYPSVSQPHKKSLFTHHHLLHNLSHPQTTQNTPPNSTTLHTLFHPPHNHTTHPSPPTTFFTTAFHPSQIHTTTTSLLLGFWSPKGKQICVGDDVGCMHLLTHDLTSKGSIPKCPQITAGCKG